MKKFTKPGEKPELTPEEFNTLQEELDALRTDIESRIGQDDIDHIENIVLIKDRLELAGRVLIHFSLDPVSWSLGVMSLSLSHILVRSFSFYYLYILFQTFF